MLLALATIDKSSGAGDIYEIISERYLAESYGKWDGWPKLVPTLQDRRQLWELLEKELPDREWVFTEDPADDSSRKGIKRQWKRIVDRLNGMLFDGDGNLITSELENLFGKIQERLAFVQITLDMEDDANAIFGKLNAKGQPLGLSDLVRNEVFGRFRKPEHAEAFHAKRWDSFEKQFPENWLDQYFTQFAYIKFRGDCTRAQAYPKLQSAWVSEKKDAYMILDELGEYVPEYTSLIEYDEIPGVPVDVNAYVDRFSRMPRTTVTWPFLMQLVHATRNGGIDKKKAASCLRMVESFLVRRAIVGWEPTGLHVIFKSLWHQSKGDPSRVMDKIVTRTIKYPYDDEILDSLTSEPVDRRAITPYVFQELERHIRAANKFDPAPKAKATLEHILPRAMSDEWKKRFNKDEHAALVGTIGNLTPLSEKQNKSVKNDPWAEKKKRYKGSHWVVSQELATFPDWTAHVIRDRNRKIADWFVIRWPELDHCS
jgi:hypothetical protein